MLILGDIHHGRATEKDHPRNGMVCALWSDHSGGKKGHLIIVLTAWIYTYQV